MSPLKQLGVKNLTEGGVVGGSVSGSHILCYWQKPNILNPYFDSISSQDRSPLSPFFCVHFHGIDVIDDRWLNG